MGLADAYRLLGGYYVLPFQFARQKSKEFVLKALQLNPDLAEAHASLGSIFYFDYDFSQAEDEFRKGIANNPSYANVHVWYANCLGGLGRYKAALEELILAEEADPLSVVVLVNETLYFAVLGRKEEAARTLKKALKIEPNNWLVNDAHGIYYYLKREYNHSIELLQEGSKLVKDSNNPEFRRDLALAYAAAGDKENAIKCLRELIALPEETSGRNESIAYVYAGLGETDEFFSFANRAFKEKTLNFGVLRLIDLVIPGTRRIRDDPRFSELFRRANLELQSDIV